MVPVWSIKYVLLLVIVYNPLLQVFFVIFLLGKAQKFSSSSHQHIAYNKIS